MSCWSFIVGGLLIMMGQHDRSEALFYYFRLEDQVPETHLLRLIERQISFAFVRERLKRSYSETGRPSIDPELLLRILLIGYLYGITSECQLRERRVARDGSVAGQGMHARFAQWQGREPSSVAADATYGNGSFCNGCWIVASLRTCVPGTVR